MSVCKHCGAEVLWARTEGGKRISLDPEPTSSGNIRLWETVPRQTKPGKLLAFVERWIPNGPGEAARYDFNAPRESAREWFGLYRLHRCPRKGGAR